MITISLCMIVKNEEDVIVRCLASVQDIADEIIIVDTGSTDSTKEIVKAFTDKIYDFEWTKDFSEARNFSYSKATKDYILWLDADDVILEDSREKFKLLKQTLDPNIDVVIMKYNVGFDEYGNVTLSFLRERLSKRIKNYKWQEPVHEYLSQGENNMVSDICITHRKEHPPQQGRNLLIYENLLSQGKMLSMRSSFLYGRELYFNGFYDRAIQQLDRFLSTGAGWIEDNIRACCDLEACYSCKGDKKNMIKSLYRSFEYDLPRGEVCCKIGTYYFNENAFEKSIFWYKLATELKKPEDKFGFILHDYWDYIPCIQLCICYYKLDNIEEAIKYNNKAGEYKPNDSTVTYNKNYFNNLISSRQFFYTE